MFTKLRDVRIPLFFIVALILLAIASCWERTAHAQQRGVDSLRGNTHNGYFGPEKDFSQRFTYRNNVPPLESVRRQQQQFTGPTAPGARSFDGSSSGAYEVPPFGILNLDSEGSSSVGSGTRSTLTQELERERWPNKTTKWPTEELSEFFNSFR